MNIPIYSTNGCLSIHHLLPIFDDDTLGGIGNFAPL